ncbi:MAG: outer membrane beta-barrel protein [Candidatus Polarisedimenticolia bacterium]
MLVLLLIVPSVPQSEVRKSFNFFVGGKLVDDLSEGRQTDLSEQVDLGLEMSFGQAGWPVMIAVDILGSTVDEESDFNIYGYEIAYELTASTFEIDAGIRKTWEFDNPTRPYLGGGLALVRGELEFDLTSPPPPFVSGSSSADNRDYGVGIWIGGGIYWKLGERFNLGFNVRHSRANVRLGDFSQDAINMGGLHAGLILGWGF